MENSFFFFYGVAEKNMSLGLIGSCCGASFFAL